MLSFSFKKLLIPTIILFSAGLFFFATVDTTNAQSNYSCPSNQYDDFGNCVSSSSTVTCPSHLAPNSAGVCVCKNSAQMQVPNPSGAGGTICVDNETGFQSNAAAGAVVGQGTASVINQTSPAHGDTTASCSGLDDFFSNPIACTARGLGYAVLTLLTYFVSLAGQIFDFSAKFSILGMGTLMGSASSGINIAWSTIRDLGNILFIFMLLWVSIMNILQMGDAKKFIPTLIIAALLINFSLFFTKIIIDTSNIVAVQFYSSITNGGATGISEAFMEKFDAETMLSGKSSSGTAWGVTAQMWSTVVMISIMFFIFLQASFLFIVRTGVLIFLLPFSPIMFLGNILPRLKEYSNKWWKELICNSLSAPIYFLLIWVSLQILSSVAVVKSGKGISDALSGLSGYGLATFESAGIIFNYLLVCVFLVASYKTAKCDGISGTLTSGLMTLAGTVAGGAGGMLLRRTAGLGAAALAGREDFKGWASKSKVGRLALQTTEGVAKSSFDVRAAGEIPLVGGMASKLAGTAGVNLDLGKKPENLKDGYRGDIKRGEEKLAKDRVEMAKLLEAKKVELTEEDKEKAKLTKEEIDSITRETLAEAKKTGRSDVEMNKLRAEKLETLGKEKIKTAEVAKQKAVTQERQKAYFDQLKSKGWGGEIAPQILKIGSEGGTKKAEKEVDQKYKIDREVAGLEETVKSLMGSHNSVKEAIDAFTMTSIKLGLDLEKLDKNADDRDRTKLIFERETAKNNARNLQRFVDSLERLKNREDNKKPGGDKKEGGK